MMTLHESTSLDLGVVDNLLPTSRRAQVEDTLREAIVRGQIPPGTQLKQDEISSQLRSSPGPVREALRQLVSEGIVVHYPNRGAFVADISASELVEVIFPTRLLAEAYAITRLTRPINDTLRSALLQSIDEMDAGAARDNLATVIEADIRFHEIVMQQSAPPQIMQLWRSVLSRIRMQLYRLGPLHATLSEVADEHRTLLFVLENGSVDEIRADLNSHIIDASSRLLAHVENPSIEILH